MAAARLTANGSTSTNYYFGQSDRGLQRVVGGITRLEVVSAAVHGDRYTLQLLIGDTYDFDNNRRDQRDYDDFRKELARLIRTREYGAFVSKYHRALYTGVPIDRFLVFASFMYAIEQAGYYHGIPWEITLPIEGVFSSAARPSPPANSGPRI